jgi:hypothetical protein
VSGEWVAAAILPVANASYLAANAVVARIAATTESALAHKIDRVLVATMPAERSHASSLLRAKAAVLAVLTLLCGMEMNTDCSSMAYPPIIHRLQPNSLSFLMLKFQQNSKFAVCDAHLDTGDAALM